MSPKGSDRGSDDSLEPSSQNVVYGRVVTSPARVDFSTGAHGTKEENNVNAKILAALDGLQDLL